MKTITVLLSVALLAGCHHAPVEKKLSDGCAIASLTALKAIQGDPYVQERGSNLVSRATQEKIDAADVAAISSEERGIAKALSVVYEAQLFQNGRVNRLRLEEKLKGYGNESAGMKTEREENAREVSVLGKTLETCYSEFDTSLRARSLAIPTSCAGIGQEKEKLDSDWVNLELSLAPKKK